MIKVNSSHRHRLSNVWFDGEVSGAMKNDARIGGIIGSGSQDNVEYYVYNCLNTGTIKAPNATGSALDLGGLVGHVSSKSKITTNIRVERAYISGVTRFFVIEKILIGRVSNEGP